MLNLRKQDVQSESKSVIIGANGNVSYSGGASVDSNEAFLSDKKDPRGKYQVFKLVVLVGKHFLMGKWSTFFVSLIPAGLAVYLCYLLATIGLSVPDDKMGMMFWGPLGAGFLGCVMAFFTPFGIAIFIRSPQKSSADSQSGSSESIEDDYEEDELDSNEFSDDELVDSDFDSDFASDDDLDASDFESDEFDDDSDADFQTAEFDSSDFDDELSGEFSTEFDIFEDEEEDEKLG